MYTHTHTHTEKTDIFVDKAAEQNIHHEGDKKANMN